MQYDMIGYLLGALDTAEHAAVEEFLKSRGEACRQLEILRRGLRPLEPGLDVCDVPSDLAARTCARIRNEAGTAEGEQC